MLQEIADFFSNLFGTSEWPARWYCGKWTSFHGWLYICSSLAIAGAYFSIPFFLYKIIKAKSGSFRFVFILWVFAFFIFACGTTHLIDSIIFWVPAYRFAAFNLFLTAIISLIAVFNLKKFLPEILKLKTQTELEIIVSQKTKELQASNEYLKNLTDDLDNFVYTASHDLKAPVNNLEGLLAIAKLEIEQSEVVEDYFNKIESQIVRIQLTINHLTDVAKLQRNPYEDESNIYFEEILQQFIENNKAIIDAQKVKIERDFVAQSIYYSFEALQIIVSNLLTNAIKYSRPGINSEIKIRTYYELNYLVLEVNDNGLGIDLKRNQTKLFGLFKRFHDHIPGSGMGLYFVKKLIEKKNGTIEWISQLGIGSTFKIKLIKIQENEK